MTTKVLWCGDSTAKGWVPPINGVPGYNTANNPSFVAMSLINARPGSAFAVMENIAIGGTTLAQWLNGAVLDGITIMPWAQRMATTDAKVVILQVGINDAFTPGVTVEGFMAGIQTMRNLAIANGKTPIFVTDNPISYSSAHNGALWNLMNAARVTCQQMGMQIIDFNDAIARFVDNWGQFLPDKIHPDETLYRFMGAMAATALTRHII